MDIAPAAGQCYATETLTADFRIAIKTAHTGILDTVRLETLDLAGLNPPVGHGTKT